MVKKMLAVFAAFIIVSGLCACNSDKPAGGEVTVDTTPSTETSGEQVQISKYPQQMDYEDYIKLTPAQQQEYYESFPDQESYMQWFNDAAQEYNQEQSNNINSEVEGNVGQVTQPTQSQQGQSSIPTEKPTKKPTTSSQEEKDPVLLTYAEYLELTPAQQQAYYESFANHEVYMAWLNAAIQEYESSDTDTETTTQPPMEKDEEDAPSAPPAIESTTGDDADF